MTRPRICARCGTPLPSDAPHFCSVCARDIAANLDAQEATTMTGGSPTPAPRADAAGVAPGRTFGAYRMERLLGRGGMGEVYAAEHLEQGRRVAVKLLHQRFAGPQHRARFLREGQLAASISHLYTVYVFGSEEILGVPVIAMELLVGGTLKDRVDDLGPMAPVAAVDAILQVIAGLEAAHRVGILHRDVKPANCFVDDDGTVKVGDFGLSISTSARPGDGVTEPGTVRGTPQFAAPEQIRGEPLDVRADIYAVGATLYYLLTGRPPFEAPNLGAARARDDGATAPLCTACSRRFLAASTRLWPIVSPRIRRHGPPITTPSPTPCAPSAQTCPCRPRCPGALPPAPSTLSC